MDRLRSLLLWAALVAGTTLAGCAATTPDTPPVDDDPAFGTTASRLLELVNDARATGRPCGEEGWFDAADRLALDARLTAAAQLHSEDMRAMEEMTHTGSDGSDLADRVDRVGYAWASIAENVAWGHPTPEAVVEGWLGSDGHCAAIMGPAFTELGAGEDGRYWTLVFARPR
jgi:uncharacterized protein YkwD